MTAAAVEQTREPGWYRYAGPIERWWDGYAWTDHYSRRGRDEVLTGDDLDAATVELAVAEPEPEEWPDDPEGPPIPWPEVTEPEPTPDAVPDDDDTPEDTVVDAPSPAPKTARRRVRLRPTRPAHAALYCPHTAADPIGDDMANSQAAQLAVQLIAAMGFDPNDVTAVHVARTDNGLEAAVTYLLPGVQVRTVDAPQQTEIVYLGY